MEIGIDARKYTDFGIGTYIRNLARVFDGHNEDRFTYIVTPDDAELVRRAHRGNTIVNSSPKYSARELVTVSWQANRARFSMFHAPHYTLPLGLSMRRVVTVHDVIHLRFPEYFSPLQRAYARMMIGHACRAADAVIVDSEFAACELVRLIGCPQEKIHVIPLGVSAEFAPGADNESAEGFRRRHGVGRQFFLYVGSLKPHKNVGGLLRAFSALGERKELQLVCVGEKLEDNVDLRALCAGQGIFERVRSLGWLDESELIAAYRAATAVVLPSLYEGFGFPVLEAMACGTPVIASNAASIPEVVGDAGLLVDPSAQRDLTRAMVSLLDDPELHVSLRARGLLRAKLFTWETCAEKTLTLYRSLA
jgi:glycosyltransferase involved in cell wall biosynthesis